MESKYIDITTARGYYLQMEDKKIYSTKEAAKKLGLSQDHIKMLARKGIINATKLGRDWVVLDLNYKRKRKPKRSAK